MSDKDFLSRFRGTLRARRPQFRFAVRVTVAGLLALLLTRTLNLPLHGLWVVLTAVVVSQMSVGGSLRATIEYLIGTLGGAVYAGAIGLAVPQPTALTQALVLALTLAPLAFVAGMNPNFRVAPFSAVLVLLLSGQLGETPVESAYTRVAEVALGGLIAVAVSMLVFPQRAHGLGMATAARILGRMADFLPVLLAGFVKDLDASELRQIQDSLGSSVTAFQALAAEARRERLVAFSSEPDPGPLARTLLRLRHDFVMLGRAAKPLPEVFTQRLGPPLDRVGTAACQFLRGSATALAHRRAAPSLEAVDAAMNAYDREVSALRNEGLTLAFPSSDVERLFALGFTLEQLHRNFCDLVRCIQERAQGVEAKTAS